MEIKSNESSSLVKVAALIIIFAGVIYAKSFITPLLLAVFISILCAKPISWLEKKRIPKWISLIIVMFTLVLLFSGFSFLIGGTISSFSNNVSKYGSSLTAIINSFIQLLNEHGLNIAKDQVPTLIQPARILEFTASVLNGLVHVLENTLLIFILVLFILMESESFPDKAKAIFSESDEPIAYFSTIVQNIRHYLWIKTLIGLVVGILIYIGLMIIGVNYALLWALIVFLLNYIPNIGSVIATIPAVLFALVQLGIGGALWTLGTFMVIHNVIGNFLEPRIMGKGLGLSTLVVFLSLLLWGYLLGTVGMLLSVPITMTIKIILEQSEKTLWLAILLGTPADAKNYLKNKGQVKKKR
jgi:predicted PurR-regulated permease PerM